MIEDCGYFQKKYCKQLLKWQVGKNEAYWLIKMVLEFLFLLNLKEENV